MKTILALAAAVAALTTASAIRAHTPTDGHWEWQSRLTPGPNRSNLPQQARVWVREGGPEVADCNCNMMKMSAADCMMPTQDKRAAPSAG